MAILLGRGEAIRLLLFPGPAAGLVAAYWDRALIVWQLVGRRLLASTELGRAPTSCRLSATGGTILVVDDGGPEHVPRVESFELVMPRPDGPE